MKNDFVEAGVVARWKKSRWRRSPFQRLISPLRYQDLGEWADSKENSKLTGYLWNISIRENERVECRFLNFHSSLFLLISLFLKSYLVIGPIITY